MLRSYIAFCLSLIATVALPKKIFRQPSDDITLFEDGLRDAAVNSKCFWEFKKTLIEDLKQNIQVIVSSFEFRDSKDVRKRNSLFNCIVTTTKMAALIIHTDFPKPVDAVPDPLKDAELHCPLKVIQKVADRLYPLYPNTPGIDLRVKTKAITRDGSKEKHIEKRKDWMFELEPKTGKLNFMGRLVRDPVKDTRNLLAKLKGDFKKAKKGMCEMRVKLDHPQTYRDFWRINVHTGKDLWEPRDIKNVYYKDCETANKVVTSMKLLPKEPFDFRYCLIGVKR